jgi:hypothetical protein
MWYLITFIAGCFTPTAAKFVWTNYVEPRLK